MLYAELVERCAERYKAEHSLDRCCDNCKYKEFCKHDCEECLKNIHFPDKASYSGRTYDCPQMMDYYVCKYTYRYASELIYALGEIEKLINLKAQNLRVLSVGCGPCTDLLALDFLRNNGICKFDTLEYVGVEKNPAIYARIYDDIRELSPQEYGFNIIPEDICTHVNELKTSKWQPDVIVLQYVFSDMQKHCEMAKIECMIQDLGEYINSCNTSVSIICNDINLCRSKQGGREYFNDLLNTIDAPRDIYELHFSNNDKQQHFDYGVEYRDNSLIIVPDDSIRQKFNPFLSCSSAQMLIVKSAEAE